MIILENNMKVGEYRILLEKEKIGMFLYFYGNVGWRSYYRDKWISAEQK